MSCRDLCWNLEAFPKLWWCGTVGAEADGGWTNNVNSSLQTRIVPYDITFLGLSWFNEKGLHSNMNTGDIYTMWCVSWKHTESRKMGPSIAKLLSKNPGWAAVILHLGLHAEILKLILEYVLIMLYFRVFHFIYNDLSMK